MINDEIAAGSVSDLLNVQPVAYAPGCYTVNGYKLPVLPPQRAQKDTEKSAL